VDDAAKKTHRSLAVEFFNRVWDLLDKPSRTADEDTEMLNAAHASLAHWLKIGNAQNFSIGEWQISRVYATLKRAEPALYHGLRALEIAEKAPLAPFYISYGHEAVARAHALNANSAAVASHLAKGLEFANKVENADERAMLLKDLDSIPQ
jgi:hypothetical protein